ncbi:MAG: response regulator [Deltaproteobacteria bacterium]|nr:response regulator [Deltaproteobacteria bacterium]
MQVDNDRILVIDDDRQIWKAYQEVLAPEPLSSDSPLARIKALIEDNSVKAAVEEKRFTVSFASQGQEGYGLVLEANKRQAPFAVIFLDIRMPPGWDGVETAANIRRIDPLVEIVIVTAFSDRSRADIARVLGTPSKFLFIRKPFDAEELKQLALSLTEKWNIGCREARQRNALSRSEARFRSLVETTSDWVWEADREGTLIYCSPVSERLFGFSPEELLGKNMFAALRAEEKDSLDYEQIFTNSAKAEVCFQAIEHRCLHKDGGIVVIESSGRPVLGEDGQVTGFRGIDRDITARIQGEKEKKVLEEQIRHTQKLEALGTLAGGVAHDMNNILTPIMGYCELAHLSIGPDHPLQSSLDVIDKSARRAANLIRQILAFSRKQVMETRVINLNTVINDFAKMLMRLIREDVELQFELCDDVCVIEADIGQMEQILLNLVVNARDAVSSNGKIIIRTGLTEINYPINDIDHIPFGGSYIVLSVIDNGQGIDQETLKMIFDPFFTTKEKGKGTGMGLATVHGIVRQHNGHIRVETLQGQGSSFHIYIPKTTQFHLDTEPQKTAEEIAGGEETLLLVEDDPAVREMIQTSLTELGYKVIAAANGNEGLALFKENIKAVDLVLTDIVMPGMGGPAMAALIKEIHPELPVVFMTGYASDQEFHTQPHQNGVTILQKPFQPRELARQLRLALDR